MGLTHRDLVRGFRRLGVKPGMTVMVHSALSTLGEVDGGADTVIDALLEVLGPEGTLVMPTMGGAEVWEHGATPSNIGFLTERWRQRPESIRSWHPTHSVAAGGKHAEFLVEGHLEAPDAYGAGTPYEKNMDLDGYVLLIGVDQDRNTTLHTLEAVADAPYLKTIERKYRAPDGEVKTKRIERMAGPHRDFIGLDRRFREAGIMRIGKVGNAVCRLMSAAGIREVGLQAFREDPAAVLCDNPKCRDCVTQRAAIKRRRLAAESFRLSAVSDTVADDVEDMVTALTDEGLGWVEVRRIDGREVSDLSRAEVRDLQQRLREAGVRVSAVSSSAPIPDADGLVDAARTLRAPAIVMPLDAYEDAVSELAAQARKQVWLVNTWQTAQECVDNLATIDQPHVRFAFDPAEFATTGEKPFLTSYRTRLRRRVAQLYLNDATGEGEPTPLARGNAEIKELVSILRCASFAGPMTLRGPTSSPAEFKSFAAGFFAMLDDM